MKSVELEGQRLQELQYLRYLRGWGIGTGSEPQNSTRFFLLVETSMVEK